MGRMFSSGAVLSLALMLVMSLQMSLVSAAESPDINLVLTKQSPYPVEPGEVMNIEVSLQNNGTTSNSLTLEILPKEPFTLLPGQENPKTFSRVGASDSVTHSYKLKVDGDAISSMYDIEFRYYGGDFPDIYVTKYLPVTVEGVPKIIISEVNTVPESMQPGDEVEIEIRMKNEGTGEARQAEASIVSETDSETGESVIVPVLSGGIFYIGDFGSGEEKTVKFKLKIENDAEYKSYLSTLTLNYKDESGEDDSVTYDVGIPVEGRPILTILNSEMDRGDFKVELSNIGTAKAKGIKVTLMQGGTTKGVSVVSEVKAGKYKAIRFGEYGYGEGTLNISYYDESNRLHYEQSQVFVDRPTSNGGGSGGGDPGLSVVLFIVVVLETIYVWRLRKRAK